MKRDDLELENSRCSGSAWSHGHLGPYSDRWATPGRAGRATRPNLFVLMERRFAFLMGSVPGDAESVRWIQSVTIFSNRSQIRHLRGLSY